MNIDLPDRVTVPVFWCASRRMISSYFLLSANHKPDHSVRSPLSGGSRTWSCFGAMFSSLNCYQTAYPTVIETGRRNLKLRLPSSLYPT